MSAQAVVGVPKANVKLGMGFTKPYYKQTIRKYLNILENSKTMTENT